MTISEKVAYLKGLAEGQTLQIGNLLRNSHMGVLLI